MKIAINTCYGGFSLSKKACKELGLKSVMVIEILDKNTKLLQN